MDNPEAYYAKVTRDYPSVNNVAARIQYFDHTEPGDRSEPTHQRVLHVRRARAIAAAMIAKISHSCLDNSLKGVMRGTPIPHYDLTNPDGTPLQPLHDIENPIYENQI